MSKTLEQKAKDFSNTNGNQSCKSMREVEYDTGRYVGYLAGFKDCQKEYEEKLRWIPIYEPPKTAELVIVDSGKNLHACVAVAFFENGIWKYANGKKLWFAPRRWRSFL